MANRIPAVCFFAITTLAPVLFPGHVLAAQEQDSPEGRPWQIALWVKGGYSASSGSIANNSGSDVPQLGLLETVSEMNPAPVYGGGVEVRFPADEFTLRLGWEALSGAEVVGRIAVCRVAAGSLCEPEVVSANVWAVSSVVRLLSGNPEGWIRPVIRVGVGLRGFSYAGVPECDDSLEGNHLLVCRTIAGLYEDPKPHLRLLAGLGLRASASRFIFEAAGNAATGLYKGGSPRTDGTWYHDLRLELSTSTRIF